MPRLIAPRSERVDKHREVASTRASARLRAVIVAVIELSLVWDVRVTDLQSVVRRTGMRSIAMASSAEFDSAKFRGHLGATCATNATFFRVP